MNIASDFPFTAAQFQALSPEEQQAITAIVDYLTGDAVVATDEALSEALNLVRPTEGCVPQEEIDEGLVPAIRRKFAAVYRPAIELAERELNQKGFKSGQHFSFCLVIDASQEHGTQVSIVHPDKPVCYLYDWCKAWHFHFPTLADLARDVLAAKSRLVERAVELNSSEAIVR
jgi:hypothetical protein